MSWRLPFVKMHGAGNDFIMVSSADLPQKSLRTDCIAALCDRRRGVGADGLIVVDRSDSADFTMTYYNADGSLARMCGNGARCAVAFARDLGLVSGCCRFETNAGPVDGRWNDDGISIALPPWSDLRLNLAIDASPFREHHFCNTGVPHLVIPVDDVGEIDVVRWGSPLRQNPALGPEGANVDWVDRQPRDGAFGLRTYERGVEAETQACGTGAAATAIVLCRLKLASSPVTLRTRGGDRLVVAVADRDGDRRLELTGPAKTAFKGEVRIHE